MLIRAINVLLKFSLQLPNPDRKISAVCMIIAMDLYKILLVNHC